jgi:hypothetical protein
VRLVPTLATGPALNERQPGGSALAESAGSPGSSVCSVCGRTVADNDIEDTNGWRWYSDGRGGLRPLCATCPAPMATSS